MLPSRGECPGLVSAQPVWRCPVWLGIWLCLFVSWGPTWQPSAVYFLPTLAHFPLLPPTLRLPWDCTPKERLVLKLCLRLVSRESGLSQHLDSNRTEFWLYII